jgi:hypothetical protein
MQKKSGIMNATGNAGNKSKIIAKTIKPGGGPVGNDITHIIVSEIYEYNITSTK